MIPNYRELETKTNIQSQRIMLLLAVGVEGEFETIEGYRVKGIPRKVERRNGKIWLTLQDAETRGLTDFEIW